MTDREKAIEILTHNWTKLVNPDCTDKELGQALDLAIKALEQPEVKGDLISREALKEHKFVGNKYVQIGGRTNGKTLESINKAYQQGWNDAIDAIIDNAPTVEQNWRFYYDHGYAQAKRDFERPQGDNKEALFVLNHLFYDCDNMTQKEYDILLEAIKEADMRKQSEGNK